MSHQFRMPAVAAALTMLASTLSAQGARPAPVSPVTAEVMPESARGTVTLTATFVDGTIERTRAWDVKSDGAPGGATGSTTASAPPGAAAAGRRPYVPLLIRKRLDSSSPRLAGALASKSVLPSFELTIGTSRIVLQRATIERIVPAPGFKNMEELRVSYRSVLVNGATPGTASLDDWVQQKK